MSRVAATAALSASVILGGAGAAGASEGCGPNSTNFDGVRLLNNGVDNTAGPFTIELEAGTYDVIMKSWDDHEAHGTNPQPEQQNEQWYFTLDSGYRSGTTIDVPTESNTSTTTLDAQQIGESTTITLHHLGESNANSVDPICVGFTPSAPRVPENEANDPLTEAREVVEVEQVEETTESVVEESAETESDPVDAEVMGIVELPGMVSEIPPSVSIVKTPPAAVESIQTQQAPVLAITGPPHAAVGATVGGALVLLGAAFTGAAAARRRPLTEN